MKRKIILLALLLLNPLYAMGDFVPGRQRADAEAKLEVRQGSGRYQAMRMLHALRIQTDGKGSTSFTITLGQRAPLKLQITRISPMRCGSTYYAVAQEHGARSELLITETRPALCRGEGPTQWRAELNTTDGQKLSSQLSAEGVPEFYMLTQ